MPNYEDNSSRERARARLEARKQRAPQPRARSVKGKNRTQTTGHTWSFGTALSSLVENYGPRFVAIAALIVLLVVSFFIGSLVRSCSTSMPADQEQDATQTNNPGAAPATPQATSSDEGAKALSTIIAKIKNKADEVNDAEEAENLSLVLEDDLVDQLNALAQTNIEARWIATHPTSYAIDGYAVQHKILKLAAEEPQASTYVRNWPDSYPAYDQNTRDKNAIKTTATGPHKIPLLFQWDPRWGYTVYSSTAFGMTGCCPTAFAMVYQGLTQNDDMTPYDMGVLAENDGYMSLYEGTDAYFLINEAAGLGLNCWEVALDATSVVAALESGQVLIANVGPGDFTTDGHFIVLTGLENGQVIVNDPYSAVRSARLWDAQDIVWQSKAIFAYTKA